MPIIRVQGTASGQGTGYIIKVQGTSGQGTGYIINTSSRYRVHHQGTGYIIRVPGTGYSVRRLTQWPDLLWSSCMHSQCAACMYTRGSHNASVLNALTELCIVCAAGLYARYICMVYMHTALCVPQVESTTPVGFVHAHRIHVHMHTCPQYMPTYISFCRSSPPRPLASSTHRTCADGE